MCVDVEPDLRAPDPSSTVEWVGADRLFENHDWLRDGLPGQAINWFLRFDHQILHLHGDRSWAAHRFGDALHQLVRGGDEVGVHPHNWRWTGECWLPDGDDGWVVENAATSIDAYASVFGHGPASFRYGDRFISQGVVRMLIDHPDVKVDLTPEPGVRAYRGLVDEEGSNGVTRHVDLGLARRYRPDPAAIDIPSDRYDLTLVPLTVGAVPGTGEVDTLVLWRDPEVFERMLRMRLFDRDLDHLAFAIRSDIALFPEAIENVTTNLATLAGVLPRLEWVRASTMALQPDEIGDQGLGPYGSVVAELDRVVKIVEPASCGANFAVADAVRSIVERNEQLVEDAKVASTARHDVDRALIRERQTVEELQMALDAEHHRAEELNDRTEAIEQTAVWRLRTALLPVLQPLARARRALMNR